MHCRSKESLYVTPGVREMAVTAKPVSAERAGRLRPGETLGFPRAVGHVMGSRQERAGQSQGSRVCFDARTSATLAVTGRHHPTVHKTPGRGQFLDEAFRSLCSPSVPIAGPFPEILGFCAKAGDKKPQSQLLPHLQGGHHVPSPGASSAWPTSAWVLEEGADGGGIPHSRVGSVGLPRSPFSTFLVKSGGPRE